MLLVYSESVVSIETFLTERRFVFCAANNLQPSSVVMSASAKTNYLIFTALVTFLSISTLPQLSRGQSEFCMAQCNLHFAGENVTMYRIYSATSNLKGYMNIGP